MPATRAPPQIGDDLERADRSHREDRAGLDAVGVHCLRQGGGPPPAPPPDVNRLGGGVLELVPTQMGFVEFQHTGLTFKDASFGHSCGRLTLLLQGLPLV